MPRSNDTLTVNNPTRSRKWGFGYTTQIDHDLVVAAVEAPTYEGTLSTVRAEIEADRTLGVILSGGTFCRRQWFFDGKPISSINGGSVSDYLFNLDLAKRYGDPVPPATITFQPQKG